jgi:hypothetical protein
MRNSPVFPAFSTRCVVLHAATKVAAQTALTLAPAALVARTALKSDGRSQLSWLCSG